MVQVVSIDRVDDHRIFNKWQPRGFIPTFEPITLVYASNGSGKSTIASLLNPTVSAEAWNSRVEISVKEGSEQRTVGNADDPCWRNVIVFDNHYVEDSLRITDGVTNAILTLGADAVQRQVEREAAVELLQKKRNLREIADTAAAEANTKARNLRTATAKQILTTLRVRTSFPSSYDARNVVKDLNQAYTKDQLSEFDKDDLLTQARATELQPIPAIPDFPELPVSMTDIFALLEESPTAVPMQAEVSDPAERDWLSTGLEIHTAGDACKFCTGAFTKNRLEQLGVMLAEAQTSLSERARRVAKQLEQHSIALRTGLQEIPQNPALYPDLTARYEEERKTLLGEVNALTTEFSRYVDALTRKSVSPDAVEKLDRESSLSACEGIDIGAIRTLIAEHNQRSETFEVSASAAAEQYKLYVLGEMKVEHDTHVHEYEVAESSRLELKSEIESLDLQIRELSASGFDPKPGADWLNTELARILGRDELELQVLDDQQYVITRHGAKVTHLSEGERTALALLHFLKSLDDKDRDTKDVCVVIDDPISSLDDSIAHAVTAMLWGHLVAHGHSDDPDRMRVQQVVVFTHNFEFFRQWSNRLDRLPTPMVKPGKPRSFVQLELRSRIEELPGGNRRTPQWAPFGETGRFGDVKLRQRLRSEYHYLFQRCANALERLTGGNATSTEQMDAESLLPNASRRVLEGFLAHRFPATIGGIFGRNLAAGLPELTDAPTRTLLDMYLNVYSHNEQVSMGQVLHRPDTATMLTFVFDYIHRLDPGHFHGMCEALTLDPTQLLPSLATPAGESGEHPCKALVCSA